MFSFTKEDNIIKAKGSLDGKGADSLVAAMAIDACSTLDFDEVSDINFAALRSMLRSRRNGLKFNIINVSDNVAEKFEDSGVSVFITICRKPKPLNIKDYEEFGAGYLSKAYNSADGDSMLKVYGPMVPESVAIREKTLSRAVMVFGIPTPLVGSYYKDGEMKGLDFERIPGKRSFSRIISDEPDRLEEITVKFAKMCKELHSTECDTEIFPDRASFYRKAVNDCKELSEEQKEEVYRFIDSIPRATTCLHGDMQLSNVISDGKDDLWIDLSDFSYGNPMMDMGMWYFLSMLNPERLCQHIFHLSKEQMSRIWDIFVEEYFGADTPSKKEEVIRMVEPYAALHMIYLGSTYCFEPFMLPYIKEKIFKLQPGTTHPL